MTLTDDRLLALASAALAEPTCSRDSCDCTGDLSLLHARVDAYCAQSLADSIERARECSLLGHVRPTGYVPDEWMQRVVRCSHCQGVIV